VGLVRSKPPPKLSAELPQIEPPDIVAAESAPKAPPPPSYAPVTLLPVMVPPLIYNTPPEVAALTYTNIYDGIFCSRPNRFIAEVEINGIVKRCHIKNTGRCKELLVPGAKVILNKPGSLHRATKYDLVMVKKGISLINIDSQAPNYVFREYLQSGHYMADITLIKSEVKYGGSRFDFYVEADNRKIFIEVKGVTLEQSGIALFPDAPTERGIKHLHELKQSITKGYEAHVVFIIQMKGISRFAPNYEIHPEFGAALVDAHMAGVKVSALDCIVTPDSLTIGSTVPISLKPEDTE